jgi:hypothetical protein
MWGLKFSADSQHLAYVAAKDSDKPDLKKWVMVIDRCEGPEYGAILMGQYGEPSFFVETGSLVFYAVRDGSLYRVTQPFPK